MADARLQREGMYMAQMRTAWKAGDDVMEALTGRRHSRLGESA